MNFTVEEGAILSGFTYDAVPGISPRGWEILEVREFKGHKLVTYFNPTKNVRIVGVRGTEFSQPIGGIVRNLRDDFDLWRKNIPSTFPTMQTEFVRAILSSNKRTDSETKTFIVGHSLGGAMAQLLATTYRYPCLSYDAPGMKEILEESCTQSKTMVNVSPDEFSDLICNIVVEESRVSSLNTQAGTVTRLPLIPGIVERIKKRQKGFEKGSFSRHALGLSSGSIVTLSLFAKKEIQNELDKHGVDNIVESLFLFRDRVNLIDALLEKSVETKRMQAEKGATPKPKESSVNIEAKQPTEKASTPKPKESSVNPEVKKPTERAATPKPKEPITKKKLLTKEGKPARKLNPKEIEELKCLRRKYLKGMADMMRLQKVKKKKEEFYRETDKAYGEMSKIAANLGDERLLKQTNVIRDVVRICGKADRLVEMAKVKKADGTAKGLTGMQIVDGVSDIMSVVGQHFNSPGLQKFLGCVQAGKAIYESVSALTGGLTGLAALGPIGALAGAVISIAGIFGSKKKKDRISPQSQLLQAVLLELRMICHRIQVMHQELKSEIIISREAILANLRESVRYLETVVRHEFAQTRWLMVDLFTQQQLSLKRIEGLIERVGVDNALAPLIDVERNASNCVRGAHPAGDDPKVRSKMLYQLVNQIKATCVSPWVTSEVIEVKLDENQVLTDPSLVMRVLERIDFSDMEKCSNDLSHLIGLLNVFLQARMKSAPKLTVANPLLYVSAVDTYLKFRTMFPEAVSEKDKEKDILLRELRQIGVDTATFYQFLGSNKNNFLELLLKDYQKALAMCKDSVERSIVEFFYKKADALTSKEVMDIVKSKTRCFLTRKCQCQSGLKCGLCAPPRGKGKVRSGCPSIANFLIHPSRVKIDKRLAYAISLGFVSLSIDVEAFHSTPFAHTWGGICGESLVLSQYFHSSLYNFSVVVKLDNKVVFKTAPAQSRYQTNRARSNQRVYNNAQQNQFYAYVNTPRNVENKITAPDMFRHFWNKHTPNGIILGAHSEVLPGRGSLIKSLLTHGGCKLFRVKFLQELGRLGEVANHDLKKNLEFAEAYRTLLLPFSAIAGISPKLYTDMLALPDSKKMTSIILNERTIGGDALSLTEFDVSKSIDSLVTVLKKRRPLFQQNYQCLMLKIAQMEHFLRESRVSFRSSRRDLPGGDDSGGESESEDEGEEKPTEQKKKGKKKVKGIRNRSHWYTNEDMEKVMEAGLALRGWKRVAGCKYLLDKVFSSGSGSDYMVAVVDAPPEGLVPTGKTYPSLYFFSALQQPTPKPGKRDDRYGVLCEILPILRSKRVNRVKVLSPCRVDRNHWVTSETNFCLNDGVLSVEFCFHNPFGGSPSIFSIDYVDYQIDLKAVVEAELKRQKSTLPNTTVAIQYIGNQMNFPKRQFDTTSCGPITCCDLFLRIEEKPLNYEVPHGGVGLRKEQYNMINFSKVIKDCPSDDESDELKDTGFALHRGEWIVEERSLGNGRFGIVFPGMFRGERVAIKNFIPEVVPQTQEELKMMFFNEVQKMGQMCRNEKTENVVIIFGVTKHRNKKSKVVTYSLVMERCEMTLSEFLEKNPNLPEDVILQLTLDIAKGLRSIHESGIIHCDLKQSNVLVKKIGGRYVAKIADMGLSKNKAFSVSNVSIFRPSFQSTEGVSMSVHQREGTYVWQAPEVVAGRDHHREGDMYSFALIVWKMIVGHDVEIWGEKGFDFEDMDYGTIRDEHVENELELHPPIPEKCHPLLKNVLELCFERTHEMKRAKSSTGRRKKRKPFRIQSKKRPSANEIVKLLEKVVKDPARKEIQMHDAKVRGMVVSEDHERSSPLLVREKKLSTHVSVLPKEFKVMTSGFDKEEAVVVKPPRKKKPRRTDAIEKITKLLSELLQEIGKGMLSSSYSAVFVKFFESFDENEAMLLSWEMTKLIQILSGQSWDGKQFRSEPVLKVLQENISELFRDILDRYS